MLAAARFSLLCSVADFLRNLADRGYDFKEGRVPLNEKSLIAARSPRGASASSVGADLVRTNTPS
jgi:hypothetical protein